jgi:hypothetical protein
MTGLDIVSAAPSNHKKYEKPEDNQGRIRGVPSKNHRPRFLNLANAYATIATEARTALAFIATSLFAGLTANGVKKARIASAKRHQEQWPKRLDDHVEYASLHATHGQVTDGVILS